MFSVRAQVSPWSRRETLSASPGLSQVVVVVRGLTRQRSWLRGESQGGGGPVTFGDRVKYGCPVRATPGHAGSRLSRGLPGCHVGSYGVVEALAAILK